jgi:hypothetical protein
MTPLGERQSIATGSSDTVKIHPFDKLHVDAPGEDQVFQQPTDLVFAKCRHQPAT